MKPEDKSEAGALAGTKRREGPVLDVVAEWLLYVSVALIATGLILPSLHKPGLLGGRELNISGIFEALWSSGHEWLAGLVIACSVVFPLVKTLIAAILFRSGAQVRENAAALMQFLGKWSMLDVFLGAFLIGFAQLADTWKVEPREGLFLFAGGVLLNQLATSRLSFSRRA